MFGFQLKHVPSIWLFLLGLVFFSLACQTAIRLLNQDGEPPQIAESAASADLTGIENSGKELSSVAMNPGLTRTTTDDIYSENRERQEVSLTNQADGMVDELSSGFTLEENPLTDPFALAILQQGYGQNEREVAYAFLLYNPNHDLTIADSEYQVIAYDESRQVVYTDSEFISLILPGQSLGIAGNLYLLEDVPIADLEIQINTGEPYFSDVIPKLDVQAVNFRPGEFFDRVTGLIAGPHDRDVEDLRVSAIAYDADGQIIGAGYALVSFIQAGRTTGVDITITNDGVVERVELFPRLSLSSLPGSLADRPKNAQDLSILQNDFVQKDLEVGYGFLLENPNQLFAIEESQYRMTAFDPSGQVIHVDEGQIDRVLPGKTYGFGSTFIVEEGEEIDSLDLQLKTGSLQKTELFPDLEVGMITLFSDKSTSIVTGEVMNPYDQAFEDLHVAAIVFDEEDRIVGGGFTWLDVLPPGENMATEVWVSSVGDPDSAQLFASVEQHLETE